MTATFTAYLNRIQGVNPRLTIGGGMLTLIVASEGMLAYLRPFG